MDIDIGDNLTYTLVSQPSYGNVSISNNQILFTPFDNLSAGSSFSDNFTFEVKDSANATDTAVVTLTVVGSNDSPVAIAGSGSSITEDSPGNITLSATDIDIGDNLTYTLVSQPSYGNVSISNNQILFTPFDNLSSGSSFSDNFTFEVKDSANATDTAVVTLTVVGSNDSPVAIAGSGSSITEDSPGNITLSATDIDIGDNLTYTLVSQPSYGNVSISNNQILFTPFDNLSSGSSFQDNFTFEVKDSANATDTAVVTLTVVGSNDSPVAIAGSGSSITEDSPGNITLSATDIDIGDNLTYTLVSQPSYGNVSISNNQILFTPFDNLSSGSSFSDNFTFEVKDSANATDTAVVTPTVVGSNDSPVAIAGSGSSITEDSPGNITLSATDIDVGDNLTYTLVSQPSYGNVSIF